MRASDVLGRSVVDRTGEEVGIVHDLRVRLPRSPGEAPVVVRLVVGPPTLRCRLAHAWGYAQDREHGPGPSLVRLLVGTGSGARSVLASAVADWDENGRVRLLEDTP
ncbi:MAG TPA: PRC-barrel domain-containing protein [Nocardioides sp.]